MADLNDGARAMETLRRELLNLDKVQKDVGWAVVKKARQNAQSAPAPQARMAASGLTVTPRGTVIGRASRRVFGHGAEGGVKLGLIQYGAEFGSFHKQFGAAWNSGPGSGYFLHPAAEGRNPDIDKAQESQVDKAIDAAIRIAGP
jgi:hypothetical protein